MIVLVLGGSGFLGSYVVDELYAAGHNIISLDRTPERFRAQHRNVEFIQADFGNRGELEQVLKRGVDIVVHLISSTVPQTSNDDPIFDVQSNLIESIALFEMCVKYAVKKVIYVSSGGTVYGIPKLMPIAEDHATLPMCSYGISKLAIEHYLHLFHVLHGLKYTVLRLSNPYGARQDPRGKQGAVTVFMNKLLKGEEISVWGDGSVVRDYIYASDFARACVAVIDSDSVGVYNVGSGVGTSINELLSVLQEATGVQAKVNYSPGRGFDVPALYLDCSRIKLEYDWQPQINFIDGLVETSVWMRAHLRSGCF
ncbi:MAG: NAD-dependent epimerase/dehydratase family protein [Gallionella sp.]|nr:NAD-dependent epimerase/dehydratase family protein [Gallionella sp.]